MKKTGKAVMRTLLLGCTLLVVCSTQVAWAQVPNAADYDKKYTLAGLTVLGADYSDAQAVKLFSAYTFPVGPVARVPPEFPPPPAGVWRHIIPIAGTVDALGIAHSSATRQWRVVAD